jgi:type IV secretion system protein TrbL
MSARARRIFGVAATTPLLLVAAAVPARADLPGAGIVKNVGGAFGGWAWDKVTAGLAAWVLGAVGSLVEGVVGFLQHSTKVDVGAVWFSGAGSPYATVRNIAITLTLGFALLAIISGALRGDPVGMLTRVATGLPATALAMAISIPVVGILLELVDQLSVAVLDPARAPGIAFLKGFGATAAVASGGFAVVLVGLLAVLAALLVWAELLVRAALIYLVVALSPLVLAATLWPATRGALRRTVEVLVALIASKLVVCVAIAVGAAALGGAGTQGTSGAIGALMIGAAILAMAAFSPFLVLRLIPIVESATIGQGISRAPTRAAQTAAATVLTLSAVGRLAGGGAAAAGAAAGGPATAGSATEAASTTTATATGFDLATRGAHEATARPPRPATDAPARNGSTPPSGGPVDE